MKAGQQAAHRAPSRLTSASQSLARLATLLRYASDGCFAIALWEDVSVRDQVASALIQALSPIAVLELSYPELGPYPAYYLSQINDAQRAERAIAFFFGLEAADADALKLLDYQRELLARPPHGLVFWLTSEAARRTARSAPHFWSQRSGVFDFAGTAMDWRTSVSRT